MSTMLTILVPALLGVFVILLFGDTYTAPIIFPDTFGYLAGAAPHPIEAVAGTRTPVYGWLMLLAFQWGNPMLIVWAQQALWLACIAAATALVLLLTESVWRAIATGALLIVSDIITMHLLPSTWFLLTDAPAALCTTLGLLLILSGVASKYRCAVWIGALLIGFSNVLRPLFVGSIVGSVGIIACVLLMREINFRRAIATALFCLWIPTVTLSIYNKTHFGSFSLSSVIGRFLMTYTLVLLEPGDKIFDDAKLNAALHETVRTGIAPAQYRGLDAYDITVGNKWHELSQFYGSMMPDDDIAVMRFKVATISKMVMTRNVMQHPGKYASLVWKRFIHNAIPDKTGAHYFTFETQDGWGVQEKRWKSLMSSGYADSKTAQNRKTRDPNTLSKLQSISSYILPKTAGPKTIAIAIVCVLITLTVSLRLLGKSRTEKERLLGLAIALCILSSLLFALAQAMVVFEEGVMLGEDPRQRLPGLILAVLAVLLTLSAMKGKLFRR